MPEIADLEQRKHAAHIQLVADNTRKLDLILSDILDNGLVVSDEDGKLVREHPPAAYLKLVHERAKLYNMGRPMQNKLPDGSNTGAGLTKALEHAGEMPEMPEIDTGEDGL